MSDDARARAEARIGAVLNDKWTLERLIGVGGMAAVYAGRHRNGARGAVKLLHPDLARIQEVRERFLREGYAANKVEHVGAVKVLDDDVVTSGPSEGSAYLIMELLDGESLEDRIWRKNLPFPIDEALAIAEDVLDALAAAHANGVIHRDLKPENLFLVIPENPEDAGAHGFVRVKVLDFGLARIAHGEGITRAGMAIGTPSYMAPEQAEGRSEDIDGRSDVFGVGAILFRLVTGRKVHEAQNVIELVAKMAKTPAPPIRSVRADVPPNVAAIIDRALKFRREERYDGAAAMRAEVRAVRSDKPLPSTIGDGIGSDPTLIATTPVAQSTTKTTRPPPPRRTLAPAAKPRRFGALVSFLWVFVVVVLGVAFFSGILTRERIGRVFGFAPASQAEVASTEPSVAPPPVASPSTAASAPPEDLSLNALDDASVAGADTVDAALDAHHDAHHDVHLDAGHLKPWAVTAKPKLTTTSTVKKPVPKKKK